MEGRHHAEHDCSIDEGGVVGEALAMDASSHATSLAGIGVANTGRRRRVRENGGEPDKWGAV